MEGLLGKVVDKARQTLGPGGTLGIIDSDDLRYKQLVSQHQKGYADRLSLKNATYFSAQDIWLVHGQEIPVTQNDQQGHLLVLGTGADVRIPSKMSLTDTLTAVANENGAPGIVHPFHKYGLGAAFINDPDLFTAVKGAKIRFWEIYNGSAEFHLGRMFPARANELSEEHYAETLYKQPLLAPVSFTDGHKIRVIGRCCTEMLMPPHKEVKDEEAFVDALGNALSGVRQAWLECHWAGQKRPARLDAFIHAVELAPPVIANELKR